MICGSHCIYIEPVVATSTATVTATTATLATAPTAPTTTRTESVNTCKLKYQLKGA